MSLLFQYLADRVVGSNNSGLNGQPTVSAGEYNRLLDALRETEAELGNKEKSVDNLISDVLKGNRERTQLKRLSEEMTSENKPLSQATTARTFISSRFRAYVKSIGLADYSVTELQARMTQQQRYTANVYLIASADYMVLQNNLANVAVALQKMIQDIESGNDEDLQGRSGYPQNIYKMYDVVRDDLVLFSRTDADVFNKWFAIRVKEIAESAKFIPGTTDIDPQTIPDISFVDAEALIGTKKQLTALQNYVAAEAKPFIVVEDSNKVFPSAYVSNAYDVKSMMMKV
jgi:hypothetical protein